MTARWARATAPWVSVLSACGAGRPDGFPTGWPGPCPPSRSPSAPAPSLACPAACARPSAPILRYNSMTDRPHQSYSFTTHDGEQLFYRHWPAVERRRGCVVMFHRGHEHSLRMAHLVDELDLRAFDFFAWDA